MRRHVHTGRWRRIAGVAALVLVVGLAATMAVPDARTAVLRFLGLKGVTVIRVDERPRIDDAARVRREGDAGGSERIVGFRPLLPEDLGVPDVVINRFNRTS